MFAKILKVLILICYGHLFLLPQSFSMKASLYQLNVLYCPPDNLCFHCLTFWCCEIDFHNSFPNLIRSHVISIMFVGFPEDGGTNAALSWIAERETVFISSAHLDLEQQMRFICNTGICVLRLSVLAAWILDKLFYTPVKWLSSGVTQRRSGYDPQTLSYPGRDALRVDLTWRSLTFFSCFTSFLGSRQTINHLNARVCSNKN